MVVVELPLFGVVTDAAGRGQHAGHATKGTAMPVKVHALDHLVINVADVARTVAWYQTILGMEIVVFDPGHGKAKRTSLMLG
jgi:catechol-2,3-dioxygenase